LEKKNFNYNNAMKHMIRFVFVFVLAIAIVNAVSLKAQDNKSDYLTLEEFEAKINKEGVKAQIIDARSLEEYQQNHLKYAINLNVSDEADFQKQVSRLKKNKPVFVYSIGNGRSKALKKKLESVGFTEVYELPGGFSNWVGSGKPVESSLGGGLTLEEYNKLIQSDNLVLVDFGSRYCGGCKRLIPVLDSLSQNHPNDLKVVKIEFFENKQLGIDLNISALPTLILYKDNKIVWQKTGFSSTAVIEKEILAIQSKSVSLEKQVDGQ